MDISLLLVHFLLIFILCLQETSGVKRKALFAFIGGGVEGSTLTERYCND